MYLPQTECQSDWHHHYSAPDISHQMSAGCPPLQVNALLAILSSEDTASLFATLDHYSLQSLAYYTPRPWKAVVEATIHAHKCDGANDSPEQLSFDDVWCTDCEVYVSPVLNPFHHGLLCALCAGHAADCSCCLKCEYKSCHCCETCGEAPGWCECCSHCSQPECECPECRDCGEKFYCCSCGGGTVHQGHGSTKVAPWTVRPDEPLETILPTVKDIDFKAIDPVQAAADFYLLDAIKSSVRLAAAEGCSERLLTEQASVLKSDSMASAVIQAAGRFHRAHVQRLLPSFLAYSVAAVGGELRYHRACSNGVLAGNRDKAWKQFVKVVQAKGPGVLFEADSLFREFGGGAYGGELWGEAAKVVGRYLNGTMPDWLFIDRVFTLQHNGGSFINKVSWGKLNGRGWNVSHMVTLLNAHSGVGTDDYGDRINVPTDWETLLSCASPEVRVLWQQSERALTRIARRYGGVLVPVQRERLVRTSSSW